jgi:hypothetical protein
MQKLTLIIFTFLFTTISFGQKRENKIFKSSKGSWEIPLNYKTFSVLENPNNRRIDLGLILLADSAYEVKALHSGKIILATKIDINSFVMTVKYGNYFISYFPLDKLLFKKEDEIKAGDIIGRVAKDMDNLYSLELRLSKGEKDLPIKNWINWKKSKN